MDLEKSKNEKVHASLRPPPMISFHENWMKELDSEVGGDEDFQQTKTKTQKSNCKNRETCFGRTAIRFECSRNQQTCFTCESIQKEQGGPVSSCVPVSVERFDRDRRRRKRRRRSCLNGPMKVNNPSICSHSAKIQTLTSEYQDCHMQL